MADNPLKYRDFITPDDSITQLITQLTSAGAKFDEMYGKIQAQASKTEAAIRKSTGATKEGQEVIAREIPKVDELAKAQEKLAKSRAENAIELTKLKALQQEQNVINKLTVKLNASQIGSYNRLSAQYSLNKIELNKMTDAQRSATTYGKDLEASTKRIYTQMNIAQKATGKFTLQVGNYKLATKETNKELKALNVTYQNNIKELRKLANAQDTDSTKKKKLLADTRALRKEMAQMKTAQAGAAQGTGVMTRAAAGLGSSLKSLAGMYLGLAGARKLWTSFTDTVIGFEKQMSSLKAISGATGDEFNDLEEDAKRLGAATTKTAIEVGALQTEYAKLGFTTDEILAATEATILLAEATGEDVAMAAQIAGATIRGFGKDAAETGQVVDVMAKSFTSSALNLERFAESMKLVAPVAKAAKVPLEVVTAALSALADAGIHGSIAGTAMRRILTEFDASGKPFGEQLDALAKKGLTLADANDEVGRRAMTALLVLSENTDKINELTTAYDEAGGSAKAMADIQRDNVAGALELAGSAWAGFNLAITEGGSIMRTVIDATTDLFNWMTKHALVIKNVSKFLLLGAIAWGTYKLAILAAKSATLLSIRSTYADIAAKGLQATATNVATGAMRALNVAVKANPIGILLTLLITAASAFSLFAADADVATESVANFNDEVEQNKFESLIEDIVTGSMGDFGKSLDKIGAKVKTLSETDLTALADNAARMVRETNREFENLEPEFKTDESFKEDFDRTKKFYQDIIDLAKEEQKKFRTVDPTTTDPKEAEKIRALELSLMEAGEDKEFAVLRASFEKKRVLFEKYGLDTLALENWAAIEGDKIREKYRKKEEKAEADKAAKEARATKKAVAAAKVISDAKLAGFQEQKDLTLSEIDLMKVTEAEKTKLRVAAEIDRIKKVLALNKAGGLELSKAQVKIMENQIKKLEGTMVAKSDEDIDLYSLAGINLDDDKKDAINESTQFAIGQVSSFLASKVQAAEAAVEASNREVEAAENNLDREIENRNAGFASNVTLANKELAMAKKNQNKALKEQEKAQKAQIVADSLVQASSLVTASAKIWGQLGFPWAIPALAVMWGSFAASKAQAFQATKQKKFADGGMGIIEGGSHASGDDVHFGSSADGTERRAEGGEAWAVFSKSKTQKYRKILPGIVNSLNKGTFEKRFMGSYNTDGLNVNVQSQGSDLSRLEGSVEAIKRQGERRYHVDAQGRTVEIYKNLKRTYNAN